MLKYMKILTIFIGWSLIAGPVEAGPFCGKKCKARKAKAAQEEIQEDRRKKVATARVKLNSDKSTLQALIQAQEQQLRRVEVLMSQEKFAEAHALGNQILADVKEKSGVNSKAKIREEIPLPPNTLTADDLALPFRSLNNKQKRTIIESVTAHKFELYLNVLNLVKRTRATQLRALYANLKNRHGVLLQSVIEKLGSDILGVRAIPILLVDPALSESLIIFDDEVADEDFQFEFNLELFEFLKLEVPEITWDKAEYDQRLEDRRYEEYKNHLRGVKSISALSKDQYMGVEAVKRSKSPYGYRMARLTDFKGAETNYAQLMACTSKNFREFDFSWSRHSTNERIERWRINRYICENHKQNIFECVYHYRQQSYHLDVSIKMCSNESENLKFQRYPRVNYQE